MSFPVVFHLGPLAVPAHIAFESLAYVLGFRVYLALRSRRPDDIPDDTRYWVIAAAAIGALIGSKLLAWLEHPDLTWQHRGNLAWLLGGKTIVGGLRATGGLRICILEATGFVVLLIAAIKTKRRGLVQGVLTGGAVAFLLCAACWGTVGIKQMFGS